jgi:hypothetical protein
MAKVASAVADSKSHARQEQRIAQLVMSVKGLTLNDNFAMVQHIRYLLAVAREHRRIDTTCCLGYATSDGRRWLPDGDYWPEGVYREWSRHFLLKALQSSGYDLCKSPEGEPGQEKIAILGIVLTGEDWVPCHAARRMDDGRWALKSPFLEPLAFSWDELNSGILPGCGVPCVIFRRPVKRT